MQLALVLPFITVLYPLVLLVLRFDLRLDLINLGKVIQLKILDEGGHNWVVAPNIGGLTHFETDEPQMTQPARL